MMNRLLIWFGLRKPSRHSPDTAVIDVDSVLAELDPDTSPFTTMLMKLMGPKPLSPLDLGGHIEEIVRARVEWIDWGECYPERNGWAPKITWMEDEFLPRIAA